MSGRQLSRLSNETIAQMVARGASQESIDYAIYSQTSMEPADVVIHRSYIKRYNPDDPWRQANNFVAHPLDYKFGQSGKTSAPSIAGMLSQHQQQTGQPIFIAGPNQLPVLPFMIQPFVQFTHQ